MVTMMVTDDSGVNPPPNPPISFIAFVCQFNFLLNAHYS